MVTYIVDIHYFTTFQLLMRKQYWPILASKERSNIISIALPIQNTKLDIWKHSVEKMKSALKVRNTQMFDLLLFANTEWNHNHFRTANLPAFADKKREGQREASLPLYKCLIKT